jgi:hypothetical protein
VRYTRNVFDLTYVGFSCLAGYWKNFDSLELR